MHDQIDIQQTLNRYTDGVSRADVQQVLSTFMPDGIYEAGGMRLEGRAAIEKARNIYVADFAYVIQISAPAVIVVEGDKATACSTIRECARYADADELLELVGTYADELVRTVEGWKLARRTFTSLGSHRLSLLPDTHAQS
jgi:ketosteroid isomerase-like protein